MLIKANQQLLRAENGHQVFLNVRNSRRQSLGVLQLMQPHLLVKGHASFLTSVKLLRHEAQNVMLWTDEMAHSGAAKPFSTSLQLRTQGLGVWGLGFRTGAFMTITFHGECNGRIRV